MKKIILIFLIVGLLALGVGISVRYYFSQPAVSEIPASRQPIVIEQKLNALRSALEVLNKSVNNETLENYKSAFADFKNISQQTISLSPDLFKTIRESEWENYRGFISFAGQITAGSPNAVKANEVRILLETHIKSQAKEAISKLIVPSKKKTGINILSVALAAEPTIIHKKAIVDPDDPGKTGKQIMSCWGYESWADTTTGDIRQQASILGGNNCITEIDITSGSTGEKLALDPGNRLAEWVRPPKIGIGDESTRDPYTEYKKKLDEGWYSLEGTDEFDRHKVYLLKHAFYNSLIPDQLEGYEMIYLDAITYLPIRSLAYDAEVIIEYPNVDEFKGNPVPEGFDPTKPKVTRTGKFINNFGIRFMTGEVIDRSSLPPDFFELKIPEGYELGNFVGLG